VGSLGGDGALDRGLLIFPCQPYIPYTRARAREERGEGCRHRLLHYDLVERGRGREQWFTGNISHIFHQSFARRHIYIANIRCGPSEIIIIIKKKVAVYNILSCRSLPIIYRGFDGRRFSSESVNPAPRRRLLITHIVIIYYILYRSFVWCAWVGNVAGRVPCVHHVYLQPPCATHTYKCTQYYSARVWCILY